MNVDEAMEIAEQLSGGSLNFRHHSNLRALAIGALYNEVNRLRAACNKYSEDEILQGDWKARALKAEAELAAAKAASVVPVEVVSRVRVGLGRCVIECHSEHDIQRFDDWLIQRTQDNPPPAT